MGNIFPIYPPEDLFKLDQQKREELKTTIRHVLNNDPDVRKLLEDKLPDVKNLLKDKTWVAYQTLLSRK